MMLRRALPFALVSAALAIACSAPAESAAPAADPGDAPSDAGAPSSGDASVAPTTVDAGVTCLDRDGLLAVNRAAYDARRDGIQAALGGSVTAANWSTFASADTWGPKTTTYASAVGQAPTCADPVAAEREYYMSVVNYWVDQGLNYCHHHVPAWTPPVQSGKLDYRNSTNGSTSGDGADPMTCTSARFADGHQVVGAVTCSAAAGADYCNSPDEIDGKDPSKRVQWNGVDCSDFTSWVNDFAGLTPTAPLATGIGAQACDLAETGVLLDIDDGNVDQLQSELRPGDMLYIRSKSDGGINVAHVVTWTGLKWSDLQQSPEAAKYDPANVGQPGSRLGGDFETYGFKPGDGNDPYMIVDSHYAGPAYRPFVGWYHISLSNVRRVIDAASVASNPKLSPYVIADAGLAPVVQKHDGNDVSYTVLVAPAYASAPASEGHRFLAAPRADNSCMRQTKD